ncbi:helix-turn-helix transcriptional regulator [Kribbella sp. VKM Ac-2568]|uniref:helix-turn-helix transcriptional regulator n=1 Tax=Kribbella sp. VKM Ac-2568 TaxID=2512219 RepID=UPI0010DD6486|nr:LuxR family transcriptional regulator [Kribbella sp. VKM Ac-2568]TCM46912.1 regulatory LuxR family protein [Kribbella sp. VKM Ac-2568]
MLTIPSGRHSAHRPHGRQRECETLDRLMANVWTGESQMLVLRGEEGVGKSTLLAYLAERASGCRIVRAAGAESERELAFAGLHQLCAPILSELPQLPDPQRDALVTVFGLRAGDAPDRLVIGMAVMGLLSAAAAERPLVCILDDAQWLDAASAQILGFAARRLVGEPVAVAIAVRESSDGPCDGSERPDLKGIPELVVGGLATSDVHSLLDSTVMGPLDERVRERIADEAGGNPLALKQTISGQGPDHLAGGYGLPRITLPDRMVDHFRQKYLPLPSATRQLVLLAAAEPTGDAVLLWRTAGELGITSGAAASAVTTRLVEFDGHVRFCHPLVRSVVYEAASPQERHAVHRALAAAIDPGTDADRRAWHRAHAASDLDEEAAAELERTADQAMARGGLPALAAFRARAAELTADPGCRARRTLAAAEAKYQAGALRAARRLLAVAQAGPLDDLARTQVLFLGAQLTAHSHPGPDTPSELLEAAQLLEPVEPDLAREAYCEAFDTALAIGGTGGGVLEIAQAVQAAPPMPGPPDGPGLLLEGLAVVTSKGLAEGAPLVKRALRIVQDQEAGAGEGIRWLPLACRAAQEVWDDKSWHALTMRLIQLARSMGALTVLPRALLSGSMIQLLAGGCEAAIPMAREAEAVGIATGCPLGPYGRLPLAAWKGHDIETSRLIADAMIGVPACGEGRWRTAPYWAAAVLNNGLGRYEDALAAATRGCERHEELGLATWSLVELIEAAVRAGAPQQATHALKRLQARTEASSTDWALGIEARSRALVSGGEAAESLYLTAIDKLGRTLVRVDLGRVHLLYGEWLRRQGRRVDARIHLRTAHEMLVELGIEGFARRAGRELEATGATVRKRATVADDLLTAQEAQIAWMAREGRTNAEISVELFLSPRTVEWHLHKVFTKLGITSRRQLIQALVPAIARQAQLA